MRTPPEFKAAQYNMIADQRLSERGHNMAQEDGLYIPDLCQVNGVLLMLILTQLLAFMIALLQSSNQLIDWSFLGLISIFCHAIVLSCAGAICFGRRFLRTGHLVTTTLSCLAIIVGVTLLFSWLCAFFLMPAIIANPFIFVIKNLIISLMLGGLLLRYFYLQHQWREQKQGELRARLQALQARIRPHFLFNSMNTIASLIESAPEQAEEAVLDLSTLFRATLNNQTILIPLEEELALCRRYLNIEGLRLGKRLSVEWALEELPTQIQVPPLSLQPLLENAIYHGIQPSPDGGTIRIETSIRKQAFYIMISNPYQADQSGHRGNRIALDNIQSRLSAIFGGDAILKTSQLDGKFIVTLRIPTNG